MVKDRRNPVDNPSSSSSSTTAPSTSNADTSSESSTEIASISAHDVETAAESDSDSESDSGRAGDYAAAAAAKNEEETLELFTRWGFNASKPASLRLRSDLAVFLPLQPKPSCTTALPILKHLAEFSYRPNDLAAQALEQFLVQDYAGALKLFDEAAELGLELAQLNSAFIYKYVLSSPTVLPGVCAQLIASHDNRQHCETHFQNMVNRRLVQLAHLKNPDGFRELGDRLLLSAALSDPQTVDDNLHPVQALSHSQLRSQQENALLAGKMYMHGALKYKDITSLMSLASLIHSGEMAGIPCNTSLAKQLYYTALAWERGVGGSYIGEGEGDPEQGGGTHPDQDYIDDQDTDSTSRSRSRRASLGFALPKHLYTYNDLGVTSGGVAPAVALLGIYVEEALAHVKSIFFRA